MVARFDLNRLHVPGSTMPVKIDPEFPGSLRLARREWVNFVAFRMDKISPIILARLSFCIPDIHQVPKQAQNWNEYNGLVLNCWLATLPDPKK